MKKSALKRVITGMVLLIAISMAVGTAYAAENKASCSARVSTKSPYTAEIIVELQRYDGGWVSESRWSDQHSGTAAVNNATYYIHSGYTYRFEATANVYDSSGNLLDSDVRHSSNMSC